MKKILFTTIAIACTALQVMAQNTIEKKDFKWLTGSWEMKVGKLTIVENWEEGEDSSYMGKGYVIKGVDTIVIELMKIDKVGDFWVFIAQVNNNKPVLFTLKPSPNTKELEFENLEHDDPQRVVYEFVSKNKLHARTEADIKGKEVVDEYNYTRR